MNSEDIYIQVCNLHWKHKLSINEIASSFEESLFNYKHKIHDGYLNFENHTRKSDIIKVIIKCESAAHISVNNF